ncbi:MAG: 6-phosphogluconolactonase [Candidatus Peribacteraceae bacterium]|jgi:6-phosphogluconolactonase|nr:6-phosphogluconolactonase [Candidatus Peribacteraceae bacterium]|tara:strand:- start:17312 stop:18007 length:696 start_codon:yes stop_codon:yes gene_type:complete
MNFEHIKTSSEENFLLEGVRVLKERIVQSIEEFGSAIVGLSGGSTPKPIYELLGKEDIDWNAVSIFLVDDRYIPRDDENSNQKLVYGTLLQHASIPENQIVFPNTGLPLDECIRDYEERLAQLLSRGIPHIVTLGLGGDGHIASLFPPVPPKGYGDHLVIHTETDAFAVHDRISTTMVVIGSADRKIFFLKGDQKRFVWEEMMNSEDQEDMDRWPAKAALQLGGGVVVSQW